MENFDRTAFNDYLQAISTASGTPFQESFASYFLFHWPKINRLALDIAGHLPAIGILNKGKRLKAFAFACNLSGEYLKEGKIDLTGVVLAFLMLRQQWPAFRKVILTFERGVLKRDIALEGYAEEGEFIALEYAEFVAPDIFLDEDADSA